MSPDLEIVGCFQHKTRDFQYIFLSLITKKKAFDQFKAKAEELHVINVQTYSFFSSFLGIWYQGRKSTEIKSGKVYKQILMTTLKKVTMVSQFFSHHLETFLIRAPTGAPVAFKTWWGHQYRVGIIYPTWLRQVKNCQNLVWTSPMSPCPQARLT